MYQIKDIVTSVNKTHITHGTAKYTEKIGADQTAHYAIEEIMMRMNVEKNLNKNQKTKKKFFTKRKIKKKKKKTRK